MNRFRITLTVPEHEDESVEGWTTDMQLPELDAFMIATEIVSKGFNASMDWQVSIDCSKDHTVMLGPGGRKLSITRIEEARAAA